MPKVLRPLVISCALLAATGAVARAGSPLTPAPALPAPVPHVGFYTVHPRVGLATYYSLSASWAGTQQPITVVARIHPAGETCGVTAATDTGAPFASAVLSRANHHTVWKEWLPASAGAFTVCTWLGNPAIATGSGALEVKPARDGATAAGTLVTAATSKLPAGPHRAVFPTAPAHVYARFSLRDVPIGRRIAIEFRDTDGHVVVSHLRSLGTDLHTYSAQISRQRLTQRLGYWLVSVRVEATTLGRIHFLVPNYTARRS